MFLLPPQATRNKLRLNNSAITTNNLFFILFSFEWLDFGTKAAEYRLILHLLTNIHGSIIQFA